MSWVGDQGKIHITIGSVPQTKMEKGRLKVDFDNDLRMVKTALLYGDSATLLGLSSSVLLNLRLLADTPREKKYELLKTINSFEADEEATREIERWLDLYEKVRRKRHTRRGELSFRLFNKWLDRAWEDGKNLAKRLIDEGGGEGVVHAVDLGLLRIHEFESPLRRLFHDKERNDLLLEYIVAVSDLISNAQTYPLFDEDTSELITTGIREGLIPVSASAISRGKEIGLTADLLSRLPLFPNATVKEILDIRQELEIPLLRFRSGIIQFSQQMQNAAWDEDFPFDAELVFRRDVTPAVLDIEEAVRSNRFLTELAFKFIEKPFAAGTITAGTALSTLAMKMSNLPVGAVAALAVGPALVAGSIVYDTYKKWREKQRDLEQNSLFFYYRAGELLSDR
jgi:hypothetical protein